MRHVLVVSALVLLAGGMAVAKERPAREGKDEVLYKGKPARFWIKQLKDRDESFRLDAVKALREIGTDGPGVVRALVRALADKRPTVRAAAREAINSLALENRIPALVRVLRDKEKSTRAAVLVLLGEVGPKAREALPDVSKALEDDDPLIRSRAATAVGKIGGPDKAALLGLTKLVADKETSVRLEAIKALGKVGKDAGSATAALIRLLTDREAPVRVEAAGALKAIPLGSKLPALTAALKDRSAAIRAYAAGELQEAGPEARAAVPALILLLDEKALRIPAAKALGKIGPDARAAIPRLAKVLGEDDKDVRRAAFAALRRLGPEARIVPVLVYALQEGNEDERIEAADDLLKLAKKARQAASVLIRALETDVSVLVKQRARKALLALGKEGVPSLVKFLKGKSKERVVAIKILQELGRDAQEAIPALTKLLDEEDEVLQAAATAALRNLGPKGKFPALLGSLKGQNWEVRVKAARELGTMGPEAKTALPALVTAFARAHRFYGGLYWYEGRDFKEGCRVHDTYTAALKTIGKQDVPGLITILQKNKDRQLIVAIAASTLADIGLPDARAAIPVFVDLLHDERCRVSAALALVRMGRAERTKAVPILLDILAGRSRGEDLLDPFLKSKFKAETMARCQKEREKDEAELKRKGLQPRERLEREIAPVLAIRARRNSFLRKWAAEALRNMGKEAIPPLLEVLKGKGNQRAYAAIALGNLGADARAAAPILAELLRDVECRGVAAYALGRIGGRDARAAVPVLVNLLDDPDEVVQATVATSLKDQGKYAVPQLVEMLKSKTRQRALAAGALGEIGPDARAAAPLLVDLLMDDQCREAAALALGRIGGPDGKRAIPILEKLLDNDDELMRRAAATSLGKVGKDAVSALLAALKKGDRRVLAAHALGEIGPDATTAIPTLVGLLDDDRRVVRMTAATALGKLGKAAVPELVELLKPSKEAKDSRTKAEASKAEAKMRFAIYALGEIGPEAKEAVPLLLDALLIKRALEKAKKGEAKAKAGEAKKDVKKDLVRRSVFLNPSLLKVNTFDPLLESDATTEEMEALALGKISAPDSKASRAAIRFLKKAVGRDRLKRDEYKEARGPRDEELKRMSRTAFIIRAFDQDDKGEEEEGRTRQLRKNLAPLTMTRMLARLAPKEVVILNLSETPTTDADLKEIARFTNLASLDLRGTQVSDAGVAKLRKVLPKAKIRK